MILSGLKYIAGRLSRSIAVVATAVALTLVSCGQDTPDTPTGEDQAGVVAFRVLAFKTAATPASRAEGPLWGNDYPAQGGDYFETNILKDQLYAMITSADCAAEYAVTNLVCTRVEENGLFVKYEYQGRVDKDKIGEIAELKNGKLHIIANAGYNPALSSETIFTRYGQQADFEAIPMWGVKEFDFSTIGPDAPIQVGDVSLLRSMAKVVIKNATGTGIDNYIKTLKSVTMSAVNTQGCLLPGSWAAIKDTKSLDRHSANIPDGQQTIPVTFNFTDDNTVEFYLPEIENNADNELTLYLTFETKGQTDSDQPKIELTESWSCVDYSFDADWDGKKTDWLSSTAIKDKSCSRFATAWNGKIYTINMKTMSIMEIDANGARDVYTLPSLQDRKLNETDDYYGTAITHDDAGNFLIGHYFTKEMSSYVWTVYSPSTGKAKHFTLEPSKIGFTPTRIDCVGRVEGDLTNNAVVHIAPSNGQDKVLTVTFSGGNGDVDNIEASCMATTVPTPTLNQGVFTAICQPLGGGNYAYYSKSSDKSSLYTISGATISDNMSEKWSNYAATGGFETFVIDGKRYYVVNYLPTANSANTLPMDIAVIDENGVVHAAWRNPNYKSNLGYSSIAVEQIDGSNVDIYVFNSTTDLNGSRNGAIAAAKLRVSGKERKATLYFRPYNNGDPTGNPYDIRRNYLYEYTVRMIGSSDIYPIVDVTPYKVIELDPIFGLTPKDPTD